MKQNVLNIGKMTEAECREFSMKANNAQIDVVTAWEAQKNGKTINDLIKERTALNKIVIPINPAITTPIHTLSAMDFFNR